MSLIIKKNTTFKIPRTGSGAPNGIPVASTNTINVVDTFDYNQTISLSKVGGSSIYSFTVPNFGSLNLGQVYCEQYSDNVNIYLSSMIVFKEGVNWVYRYIGLYECDGYSQVNFDKSSVEEINNGIIPTIDWSPSLTITAA